MTEKELRLFARIMSSPEGGEFLSYLKALSLTNYRNFKGCDPDENEYRKGFAVAVDTLAEALEEAEERLRLHEQNLALKHEEASWST